VDGGSARDLESDLAQQPGASGFPGVLEKGQEYLPLDFIAKLCLTTTDLKSSGKTHQGLRKAGSVLFWTEILGSLVLERQLAVRAKRRSQ
jgi:hypothetical protein